MIAFVLPVLMTVLIFVWVMLPLPDICRCPERPKDDYCPHCGGFSLEGDDQ